MGQVCLLFKMLMVLLLTLDRSRDHWPYVLKVEPWGAIKSSEAKSNGQRLVSKFGP